MRDEEQRPIELAAEGPKKAVESIADAAQSMGLLEDLLDELARRRGILLPGIGLPRPGERRAGRWRGRKSGSTVSADRTPKEQDAGELSSSDQMGDAMWKRFQEKMKQRRPRGRHGEGFQED
ncbi:MAG TPA: hypothetical protein PLC99_13400 [Verrucomicrobiota bacterium]|nr:hypothetical protein [Verrucomicrobiota bacterium]